MTIFTFKKPIYPKSVAIWLIENTALTFKQIANFCDMHILEIEALANEEIHKTLKGMNPIQTGEVTEDDIKKCEQNSDLQLTYVENTEYNKLQRKYNAKKLKIKRIDKLGAILWAIETYKNASEASIAKLLKTTSSTVKLVKDQKHKNQNDISAVDPISIGLITKNDIAIFEENNNT